MAAMRDRYSSIHGRPLCLGRIGRGGTIKLLQLWTNAVCRTSIYNDLHVIVKDA